MMLRFKRIITVMAVTALAAGIIAGCGAKEQAKEAGSESGKMTVLKVGATPVPHAEILKFVTNDLAKEGVKLEVVEFQDYVQPNIALADGDIDANFFQHKPYLDSFNAEHKLNLVSVCGVHIEPMGIYSNKIKKLDELTQGAKIAIPNDPSNGGRALLLLQTAGLIKLKPEATVTPALSDIVENKKKLEITELEAAMLSKTLDDVDAAIINTNYAIDAGLNPIKDALFMENSKSPYVNILVVRAGDENKPAIKKLAAALTSEKVRKFIEDKYKGAIVPAF